ncbi:MAG: hypothetical protein AAGF86_20750, partial [Pseudomonadota bacterium]
EKDAGGNTFDAFDSDVNVATGATDIIILGEGEDLQAVDAGIYLEGFVNPYRDPTLVDDFDQII